MDINVRFKEDAVNALSSLTELINFLYEVKTDDIVFKLTTLSVSTFDVLQKLYEEKHLGAYFCVKVYNSSRMRNAYIYLVARLHHHNYYVVNGEGTKFMFFDADTKTARAFGTPYDVASFTVAHLNS